MKTGTVELFVGADENGTSSEREVAPGLWGILVGGTLDGTVTLELSDDNGATWVPVSAITDAGLVTEFLPSARVRATLSGVTATDVNVRLKPIQLTPGKATELVALQIGTPEAYAQFDSVDDYIEVDPAPFLLTGDCSVAAWIKPESHYFHGRRVVSIGENGEAESVNALWSVYLNPDGELSWVHEYGAGNNEDHSSTQSPIPLDTWTHVAIVRDDTKKTLSFYVNGEMRESISYTNSATGGASSTLNIGRFPTNPNTSWDGGIASLQVWDRVVEPTEMPAVVSGSPPPYGLLANWKLDEVLGNVAHDSHGTNHGSCENIDPATFWSGYNAPESFATFDGVDDRLNLSQPGFTNSTKATYSFFARTSKAANQYLLDSANDQRLLLLIHHTQGGAISYYEDSATFHNFGSGYNDGLWHHFAIVVDDTTVSAYVDGSLIGSESCALTEPSGNSATAIGSRYTGDSAFLDGDIAEFKIFNDALTAENVEHLCTSGQRGDEPSPLALVVDLQLNEVLGSRASDSSQSGNYATAVDIDPATFWSNYEAPAAFATFDGVNDFISVPSAAKMGSGDYSVTAFVRSSSASLMSILADRDTGAEGTANGFYARLNHAPSDGTLDIWMENADGKSVYGNTNVCDGNWHHVAFTWDNSEDELLLYVDGHLEEVTEALSANLAGLDLSSASDLEIGRRPNDAQHFDGDIADIRIYDRKLESHEVASLDAPGAIVQYTMDETGGTTVADSSGSGNDGTAENITPSTFWSNYE